MTVLRRTEKKKRPRTCAGCGGEFPKHALLRVVRTPEGAVEYDPTGRANGRGAYVCRNGDCVKAAKKRRAFSRMLKVQVGETVYDELARACADESND